MNERDFIYWLKGFYCGAEGDSFTAEQTQMIKKELQSVFTKVTPSYTITEEKVKTINRQKNLIQSSSTKRYC